MSNYTSTAKVNLQMNGEEPKRVLQQLRQRAFDLENALGKAAKAGNKTELSRLRREIKSTNRQIKEMESATMEVDRVMKRLDKATPKELQHTLRTLEKQLNSIERGSAAWNAQTAKIKAVKAELAKVNATLATQQTMWQRMNNWLNNCQTALLGIVGALTGLIMAGRKAVNSFAQMEEQLANTRKYTGMTEENVLRLNEAFNRMDTRTPRERLNELAQEAGRLGKRNLETVQAYVEAADIINVALVDLGEGATQTIAKITNIFGVEELLGIKDAMLAVGSTVNVLSQNCTASKPYLVNFAQRMAGIGSQAGMTIPQILAFGAVLDANGQKVEMSATALQKVLMKLANKSQEFAATVGLDANKLNETLKHSAKDGLLMFLEALQNMGKSVGFENATMTLAPAFKEMGLDAARVSQVLSTLAMHIDEVKWQLGEADKAFNEASSASREYEIFNNTAQASIDKARKRVSELAIELGEKLFPVMRHIYTSSGFFLRVLNKIVDFIITYKGELIALAATIITYNIAVNAAAIKTKALAAWQALGKAATVAWTVATKAGAVVAALLTGNIKKAREAFIALSAAMKMNPMGLLAAAIAAVVAGFALLVRRTNEAIEAQKALNDVKKHAAKLVSEERFNIELLVEAAQNENLSMAERQRAVERLNKIIPGYNAQLDATTGKYQANKRALDSYIESLVRKYEIEGARDKIREIGKEIADLKVEKEETDRAIAEAQGRNAKVTTDSKGNPRPQTSSGAMAPSSVHEVMGNTAELDNLRGRSNSIDAKIKSKNASLTAIKNTYGDDLQRSEVNNKKQHFDDEEEGIVPTVPTPTETEKSGGGDGGGNTTSAVDKFEKEKQWKEREEALNRISYANGQKSYEEYTKRMDEIAIEFYNKQLEHTDVVGNERLTIQAQHDEALVKQAGNINKLSLEQEKESYNARLAEAKQFYVDGKYSTASYNEAVERIEAEHLANLVKLAEDSGDAKKIAEAKRNLTNFNFEAQKKKQEALEQAQSKLKKDYFGDNIGERQAAYDKDLENLQKVYEAELAATEGNASEKLRIEEAFEKAKLALRKKYALDTEEDNKNRMEKMNENIKEWLKSDVGKAVTGSFETMVSGMSSIFSQLSSLVQAELDIQTAAIEKRYEKEISLAEGNTYKTKKLEEQKEKDIAKAKNEANRKMFAMQVIQAVAQTAQNALSAYGSAAAIPVVGYILAPIAAAMAVAAGTLQVAAIKKQQQASEAQGYAQGGYTRPGSIDEPAGIVHAGEWVASQRLLANPVASSMIQALDYAQRTNTIGALTQADVSRSITAPLLAASGSSQVRNPQPIVADVPMFTATSGGVQEQLIAMLSQLSTRLNEPFVTVNTVTGDTGIKKAQDEYNALMRNKTPKSRRQ